MDTSGSSVDFFLEKLVSELEDARKDRAELLYQNELLRSQLQTKSDRKEITETVEVQQLKAEILRLSAENDLLEVQMREMQKRLETEDLQKVRNEVELLRIQLQTTESKAAEFRETIGAKLNSTKTELTTFKEQKVKLNAELMRIKAENEGLVDRTIRLQSRVEVADANAKDIQKEMFSAQLAFELRLRTKDEEVEAKLTEIADLKLKLTQQKVSNESRLDLIQAELDETKFKLTTTKSMLNTFKEQLRSQEVTHADEVENLRRNWAERLRQS